MMTLYGRNVQISRPYPRMKCSLAFEATQDPDLVEATNKWMAGFFGYTTLIPDGVIYELNRDTLVMTEQTFQKMRAAIAQEKAQ